MTVLRPGMEFSGYALEEEIGRGGMGVVYRARQARLDRRVALKVIAQELARDPQFRFRFERESRTAAAIEHPNVIPIYEAGESDGVLFLAMRYIEGSDLGALLAEEGALEPARAVKIIEGVASALDVAHEAGLVHRDIKPGNILISGRGPREQVYLTDFGLTKSMAGSVEVTKTGMIVGTVDYMAPEQWEGGAIDARADVYALGCVLHQVLTGQIPFERDSDPSKMYAHLSEPPPPVTAVRPELPRELDDVVARAMAKAPGDRYPSAGDLGRAAKAAAEGRSPQFQERTVAAGAAAPTAAPPPPEPAPQAAVGVEPTPRTPGSRRPLLAAGVGAAAVAAVAGVLLVSGVFGGDDEPAPEPVVRTEPQEPPSPPSTSNEGRPSSQSEDRVPAPAGPATGPLDALRNHFDLLVQGRYGEAANDLTPALMAAIGGREQWIQDQIDDQLQDFQLDAFVAEQSADSATIIVDSLRTVALESGCNVFSGSYQLVSTGRKWLLDEVDFSQSSC